MSGNASDTVDVNSKVNNVAEVGGVRAFRLKREFGVETVGELADLTVDELTSIWSIGEWTAEMILESVDELLVEEHVVIVSTTGHMADVANSENMKPWTKLVGAIADAGVELENPNVVLHTMFSGGNETRYLDGTAMKRLLENKRARLDQFRADIEGVPMWMFYERHPDNKAGYREAFTDRDKELVQMADRLIVIDDGLRSSGDNHDDWWSIDRMLWLADQWDVEVHAKFARTKPTTDHVDEFDDFDDDDDDPRGGFEPDIKDQLANTDKPGRGAREEIQRSSDNWSDWASIEDAKEEQKRNDGQGAGSKNWSI